MLILTSAPPLLDFRPMMTDLNCVSLGPAVFKRGNRDPWSASVARGHPRTTDHRKIPLRVRVRPDNEHGNIIGGVDMERGPDSV